MKKIVALSIIGCFIGSFLLAQSRITITAEGKDKTEGKDITELPGFALESTKPGQPGQSEQIIICKNFESQGINFHFAYGGGTVSSGLIISFFNTGASGVPDYKIRLSNATVSGYKQYTGIYKNVYFANSGSGTGNEEIILTYGSFSLITQRGS